MKKEIEYQIGKLKFSGIEKNKKPSEILFVGSGDSFVSGLIASYESNFNCLCIDPAEIIINPTLSKKKTDALFLFLEKQWQIFWLQKK
ncbi:MAG TPA: hypothetical protein VF084_01480 [Nitrososphaeraceae archaeon]